MAQCNAPAAVTSVNTVAIRNISQEQAGANGMAKTEID